MLHGRRRAAIKVMHLLCLEDSDGCAIVKLFHRTKLDRCASMFCTGFWKPLSMTKPSAEKPSTPDMMSALTPQEIVFAQISVGPTTIWGVDVDKNIYWWDGHAFAEYNYAYELVQIEETKHAEKETNEGKAEEEDNDDDEIFDVDMNSIRHVSVGCIDGSVFGALKSGKILCLKHSEKTGATEEEISDAKAIIDKAPAGIRKIYVLKEDSIWALDAQVILPHLRQRATVHADCWVREKFMRPKRANGPRLQVCYSNKSRLLWMELYGGSPLMIKLCGMVLDREIFGLTSYWQVDSAKLFLGRSEHKPRIEDRWNPSQFRFYCRRKRYRYFHCTLQASTH